MSDEYYVDTDVLRDDANLYFAKWKDTLLELREAVPTTISSDDFSHIPGADSIYLAYMNAAGQLQDYLESGSKQMEYFARTLLTTAQVYLVAEDASQADVQSVANELDAL